MRIIDADELRAFLDRQYQNCHGYGGNKKEIYREAIRAVKSYVHGKGQVDAAPVRHGHWVAYSDYKREYYCSNCGVLAGLDAYGYHNKHDPYCRFCGAKMDEGSE